MERPKPKIREINRNDLKKINTSLAKAKNQTATDVTGILTAQAEMRAEINALQAAVGGNRIFGADLYVQDTEPGAADCVWIDTNGIDLILQ
jgi:hypothetical protein